MIRLGLNFFLGTSNEEVCSLPSMPANLNDPEDSLQASSDRDCSCSNQVWRVATAINCFVLDFFKGCEKFLTWLWETLVCKAPEDGSISYVQQNNQALLERLQPEVTSILNQHFLTEGPSPLIPFAARAFNNEISLFIGCKLGEKVLYTVTKHISPLLLEEERDEALNSICQAMGATRESPEAPLQITTVIRFENDGQRQVGAKVSTYQNSASIPNCETATHKLPATEQNWNQFISQYQLQQ